MKLDRKQQIIIGLASFATLALVSVVVVIILIIMKKKQQSSNLSLVSQGIHMHMKTGEIYSTSPIHFTESDRKNLQKLYGNKPEFLTPRIAVFISSYRDPELCVTLQDLYEKAFNRDRIFICVVEQNDPGDPKTCHCRNAKIPSGQLRYITLHYKEAKGPTHARSICETLWQGEDYYLMTDSHMRFEPGWDVELFDNLFKCPRPMKTVITMYPEGYERTEKDGAVKYKILNLRRGWRYEQIKYFNDQGIVEFESVTTYSPSPKKPQRVPMYSANFVFAHSNILRDVPFHPNTPYLFFGEEQFMAARLFTHGYDLYGPMRSVVYHLWKRDYRKTYWSHDVVVERNKSIERIKDIMTGKIVDTKYGMGNVRTWKEFCDYLGIDHDNRSFTREKKPWSAPKDLRQLPV
jgi:[Skp1-protein]-hydroxyproline N-acetylglucosaminyltransferase